jgi:hypothetical protein
VLALTMLNEKIAGIEAIADRARLEAFDVEMIDG